MERKRLSGATMVEVLVVGSVFLLLLTAVLMIYTITVRMERQIGLKSDIDRSILAATRHVDSLIKSSRLILPPRPDPMVVPALEPTKVTSLTLQPLKLDAQGNPVANSDGFPEWGAEYQVNFDQASHELRYEQSSGDLLYGSSKKRTLASFGDDSELYFERPSKGLLKMSIKIAKKGAQGYETAREAAFQFRLFNQ